MASIFERIEEWKKLQTKDLGPAGIRRGREVALRIGRCSDCGVVISIFPDPNLALFDGKPQPPAHPLCDECFNAVQDEIAAKHDEPDGGLGGDFDPLDDGENYDSYEGDDDL